ncbi:hypothetical protein Aduo_008264 [Ancylostoma duodenale]
MALVALCFAATSALCPDLDTTLKKSDFDTANIVLGGNLVSMREVNVKQYGHHYHHMELNMRYDNFYKWKSEFRQDLAPNQLTMPMSTYERCNQKYIIGNVYIVGCLNLHRCFFMKRFNNFTEEEWHLLNGRS